MNTRDGERLGELLRKAMTPVVDTELKRDLWPEMLRKLDQHAIRVPWYDWALVAVLAVWLCLFPKSILALVYHL